MKRGKGIANQYQNCLGRFQVQIQRDQVQQQVYRLLSGSLQEEMSGQVRRRRQVLDLRGEDALWKLVNGPLLTPREREVVTLKILKDLTHAEIASVLNCTERTSQRIYKSAIRKLTDAILY